MGPFSGWFYDNQFYVAFLYDSLSYHLENANVSCNYPMFILICVLCGTYAVVMLLSSELSYNKCYYHDFQGKSFPVVLLPQLTTLMKSRHEANNTI